MLSDFIYIQRLKSKLLALEPLSCESAKLGSAHFQRAVQ